MTINVGVYQDAHHPGGWREGLKNVHLVLAEAAEKKLDLVLFPELYLSGYMIGKEKLMSNAITKNDDVMEMLKEIARKNKLGFAIGYPEKDANNPSSIYNSMCVIDARGNVILNYRKSHLYDPDMEYEKVIFTAGNEFPVADMYFPRVDKTVKIGALICFDIEFPEPARMLALQGASIILVGTADTENATHTPHRTVPCRAAENGVFVLYANYTGPCTCFSDSEGAVFHGQSTIFAPDGSSLANFKPETATQQVSRGILCAQLNEDLYREHKRKNDYLKERRPDIYYNSTCL